MDIGEDVITKYLSEFQHSREPIKIEHDAYVFIGHADEYLENESLSDLIRFLKEEMGAEISYNSFRAVNVGAPIDNFVYSVLAWGVAQYYISVKDGVIIQDPCMPMWYAWFMVGLLAGHKFQAVRLEHPMQKIDDETDTVSQTKTDEGK
jgi:hypothetical protein